MNSIIDIKDIGQIRLTLSDNPLLANEAIPYDDHNLTKAHPLHRLCDRVFSNQITKKQAVDIAKLLMEFGADINGGPLVVKQDTPLIAASSLNTDQLALLYIDHEANILHAGCHGGTALHWAAWCGRDVVVKKLIEVGSEINKLCIDFQSTPLFWAIHGLKNNATPDTKSYLECVRLLLAAGAVKRIPNFDGATIFDLLADDEFEFRELLNTYYNN